MHTSTSIAMGRGRLCLLIWLVMVGDIRGTENEESPTGSAVNDLLVQIHKIPDSNPRIVELKSIVVADAAKMKAQLDSIQDTGVIEAVTDAFGTAVDSVEKFTSSDPKEIVSGVLDLIGAFAPLLGQLRGPVGTAIGAGVGAIASVANGILGLFGGAEKSMSDVMKEVLDTGLANERNHQLVSGARGVKEMFQISQAFLNGIRLGNGTLAEHEVCALSSHIPIYLGVEYMGTLANEMEHNCYQNHDIKSPPADLLSKGKTCVRLLKLYTDLAVLQDYILLEVYALLQASKTSESVAFGVDASRKSRLVIARSVLGFLHRPTPEYLVPVSIYRLQSHPEVEKFLHYLKDWKCPYTVMYDSLVNSNRLTAEDQTDIAKGKFFTMNPDKFPQYYVHYYFGSSSKWFGGSKTNATWLYFKPNGTFFTVEPVSIYLRNKPKLAAPKGRGPVLGVMDPTCNSKTTACGTIRVIKVYLKNDSTRYVFTTKQFPQYFMYMADLASRQLYTWLGDPGPSGHWTLHKQTDWSIH